MRSPVGGVASRASARVGDAEAVLGLGHPLVCAMERVRVVIAQMLVTGALSAGAVVTAAHESSAAPLALAAGVVELGLACRLAVCLDRKREEARNLIADGRDELPLAVVQKERRRLADPRHRAHLARWTDGLTLGGDGWPAHPIGSVGTFRAVTPELREVAALLRSGTGGIRGVALMEKLLTRGCSSLYGNEAGALRGELGRVRYYLRSGGR
jgi:hypothetical protein